MTQLALASRRYKIQVLTNAMSRSHSSSKLSCLKLSATGSTASRQQTEDGRKEREDSRQRSIFIKAEVSQSAVLASSQYQSVRKDTQIQIHSDLLCCWRGQGGGENVVNYL